MSKTRVLRVALELTDVEAISLGQYEITGLAKREFFLDIETGDPGTSHDNVDFIEGEVSGEVTSILRAGQARYPQKNADT